MPATNLEEVISNHKDASAMPKPRKHASTNGLMASILAILKTATSTPKRSPTLVTRTMETREMVNSA